MTPPLSRVPVNEATSSTPPTSTPDEFSAQINQLNRELRVLDPIGQQMGAHQVDLPPPYINNPNDLQNPLSPNYFSDSNHLDQWIQESDIPENSGLTGNENEKLPSYRDATQKSRLVKKALFGIAAAAVTGGMGYLGSQIGSMIADDPEKKKKS
jgi:hypothetical protein